MLRRQERQSHWRVLRSSKRCHRSETVRSPTRTLLLTRPWLLCSRKSLGRDLPVSKGRLASQWLVHWSQEVNRDSANSSKLHSAANNVEFARSYFNGSGYPNRLLLLPGVPSTTVEAIVSAFPSLRRTHKLAMNRSRRTTLND